MYRERERELIQQYRNCAVAQALHTSHIPRAHAERRPGPPRRSGSPIYVMYIYIYIHIYTSLSLSIYIYIYIERERENVCNHIYIYIYIQGG